MNQTIKIQRNIAFLATALFLLKIIAWWSTRSVAIFTDALESIVNVATGFISLYSVWLASKPRDRNHPYGHGKVEFISAAIEGTLISVAGVIIIIEVVRDIHHPVVIQELNFGVILLAVTAIINGMVGYFAIRKGKNNRSAAVEAEGRHLTADTYSTAGVVAGLVVLKLTGWLWLDEAIALTFACVILYTGYKVIRNSLAGIMDEADMQLLKDLIGFLDENRRPQWIDLHNFRIIKYGNIIHLDGHLTLPWYYNVKEAHEEVKTLEKLIQQKYGEAIETFLHVDYCETFSCEICALTTCPVRVRDFKNRIEWDLDNVLQDRKHNSVEKQDSGSID